MVLCPRTGLGRLLLFVIIISTISYLVLNLVSFGGTPWITYTNVSITFGLWTVCYTSESGVCNQWAANTYDSNINDIFTGKPGFIQSSQALEIISLIFYIFAAFLIILGIINLGGLSFKAMFLAAAMLLFISIIFISATLGVMSVQGRSNYSGFLDWAWWNGLVGLIMTIVCFFSLFALILDMKLSPSNRETLNSKKQKSVDAPSLHAASIGVPLSPVNSPLFYSQAQIPTDVLSSLPMHYPYDQGYLNQHSPTDYFNSPQYNSNNYFPYDSMQYGGQYPFGSYDYNQTLPPMISSGALDYALRASDAQFQQDLIQPYYTNTYL
ncbi:unnamed protein product [Rotaria sp. Silwood1]|nr:unnamed protein product [Rotaria sp. Silwood1]CAF3747017.1 unnamed protein product [Rotaria sp. Silwood1]CAF3811419.1 unnamed protein product [Rotaria sp. Silwood1]CAF4638330.1 unnamed protein product [Rotaria sp. Silwood1]CAF4835869.1 unnamed protein product [Rotaria sp. Silwood1]